MWEKMMKVLDWMSRVVALKRGDFVSQKNI